MSTDEKGRAAKRKGASSERKTIRALEAAGYRASRLNAQSSLGEWDAVGISTTDTVLVQVKSNRGPSPAERENLQMFQVPPNCRKLIHVWRDGQREPDVEEV